VNINRILKRKELLLSLGVILAGLFGAKYVFQKQQDKIRQIHNNIVIEQERLALAKELVDLRNKLIQISAPYLEKDTSFAIDKLKGIVSRCGAKIASVTIEKGPQAELYEVTQYRLSLQADYHSLGKLLSILESLPDILKVEEISVMPQQRMAPAKDIKALLNVNMRLSATFIRP
jgi:hypothetical protein